MENEIKVNEYVRTKRGIIDRVVKISDNYIFLKSKFFITEYGESSTFIKKTDIVKHSSNLIDLIQCGDYVNGHKVLEIKRNAESGLRYLYYDYVPIKYYVERTDKIESIATKEMMESISYKVKQEEN